jgi:hypothetical protein
LTNIHQGITIGEYSFRSSRLAKEGEKMKKIFSYAASIGLLLFVAVIAQAKTYVDEFEAKILSGHGPDAHMARKFRIAVEGYTSSEEVLQLMKIFQEQGYKKYRKAFHKMKKGFIRPMGGLGTKITINAAQDIQTASGREIILVGESQSWDQDSIGRVDRRFPYLVIKLHLDEAGEGTGEIYVQANIRLYSQGAIRMSGFNLPPKQLPWVTTLNQ